MNSNGNSLSHQAVRITMAEQDAELGVIEYNSRGARLVLKGDIQKGGCFPVSIHHMSNHLECWAQVLWTKPLSAGEVVAGVEFTEPPSGAYSLGPNGPAPRQAAESRNAPRRVAESHNEPLDFWSTSLDLWQAG